MTMTIDHQRSDDDNETNDKHGAISVGRATTMTKTTTPTTRTATMERTITMTIRRR
jgi:hypothetical protein